MLHPQTLAQFERLKRRYPGAQLEELGGGTALVAIADFALPAGWTQPSTTIRFLVPVGYPGPQPDCFWASSGLRLQGGGVPNASQDPNTIPGTNQSGLWFSWHVTTGWHPSRDDLSTYVSIIAKRFEQLR